MINYQKFMILPKMTLNRLDKVGSVLYSMGKNGSERVRMILGNPISLNLGEQSTRENEVKRGANQVGRLGNKRDGGGEARFAPCH